MCNTKGTVTIWEWKSILYVLHEFVIKNKMCVIKNERMTCTSRSGQQIFIQVEFRCKRDFLMYSFIVVYINISCRLYIFTLSHFHCFGIVLYTQHSLISKGHSTTSKCVFSQNKWKWVYEQIQAKYIRLNAQCMIVIRWNQWYRNDINLIWILLHHR